MQVPKDRPGVYWKLLVLVALDRKSNDTSAHELLSLGSCDVKVLHGAYNIGQKHGVKPSSFPPIYEGR